MARTPQDTAVYFPHDAHSASGGDDTLTLLMGTYGNNGFAVYYKIKEKLAQADGHYLDLRSFKIWKLFVNYLGVDENITVEIIDFLVEMGEIDVEMWANRIIWWQRFVNSLEPLYKNRRRELPEKPVEILEFDTVENGVSIVENGVPIVENDNKGFSTVENGVSTTEIPQSKVKYSKVEESKVKESKVEPTSPPWLLLLTQTFSSFKPETVWIDMIERSWKDIDLNTVAQEFVSFWKNKNLTTSLVESRFVNSLQHARENGKYNKSKTHNKDDPDRFIKGKFGHVVQR